MVNAKKLNRVGEAFNATFMVFTAEQKAPGCWSTVHKATKVLVPSENPQYPPRTQYWTLCGKELFYQMQETNDSVTCKSCLRRKQ